MLLCMYDFLSGGLPPLPISAEIDLGLFAIAARHQPPWLPFPYLRINQTRRWRSAAWATSCACQMPDPSTSTVYAAATATGSRGTRAVTIVIPDGVWTIRRTAPPSVMAKSTLG